MPLNYSKWDQLELSDDSDIEGHPNVDKKSLIRWKQRDIHEKREARKAKMSQLRIQIDLNRIMLDRLNAIRDDMASKGHAYFSSLVEQLRTNPSTAAPPTGAKDQPTYDGMILSLLLQIWEGAKQKGVQKDDTNLDDVLLEGINESIARLKKQLEEIKVELETEEKESRKKITSEDIHDAWDSKYVPPKPEPPAIAPTKEKKTKIEKETVLETLNPQASSLTVTAQTNAPIPAPVDDDEDELPQMTPSLMEFSKIPYRDYERSWTFIQENREVYVFGATDALLVEAFAAERRGEKSYAKQCVHQGLLLQYCDKLGKDGVSLFFKRMMSDPKRAQVVFIRDVEDTYKHLAARVKAGLEEEATHPNGREAIQLMQEDPSKPITFNVPDGPPPQDIRLEGPGTEGLDIEQVRQALQTRWDVFLSFSAELQEALKTGTLEAVNNVLGDMNVEDAEEIVRLIQAVGILSLSDDGKVRDMTQPDTDTEATITGEEEA